MRGRDEDGRGERAAAMRWRRVAAYLLYVVSIGGDFMSGRFLGRAVFAAVLVLTRMAAADRRTWVAVVSACVRIGSVSAGCR